MFKFSKKSISSKVQVLIYSCTLKLWIEVTLWFLHFSKRKHYVGDFKLNDLDSPNRRYKYWLAIKREYEAKNNKIWKLKKENKMLKKKINTVEQTIEHLKKDNHIYLYLQLEKWIHIFLYIITNGVLCWVQFYYWKSLSYL